MAGQHREQPVTLGQGNEQSVTFGSQGADLLLEFEYAADSRQRHALVGEPGDRASVVPPRGF